jgi:hypothetical protein
VVVVVPPASEPVARISEAVEHLLVQQLGCVNEQTDGSQQIDEGELRAREDRAGELTAVVAR